MKHDVELVAKITEGQEESEACTAGRRKHTVKSEAWLEKGTIRMKQE